MINLSDVIPSLFINKYASFLQISSQGWYLTMIAPLLSFYPLLHFYTILITHRTLILLNTLLGVHIKNKLQTEINLDILFCHKSLLFKMLKIEIQGWRLPQSHKHAMYITYNFDTLWVKTEWSWSYILWENRLVGDTSRESGFTLNKFAHRWFKLWYTRY